MNRKSIIFLSFLVLLSCKTYQNTNIASISNTNPNPSASSELNLSSSPKPSSTILEESPAELPPLQVSKPFIIGKPSKDFNSSVSSIDEADKTPIIPSKVSGYIKGYDVFTGNYVNIPKATVIVGNTKVIANEAGFYTTDTEFSDLVDISGQANGYISSTITKVRPGINRDIYLQSLNSKQNFNPNTIIMEFKNISR
ncbi:MAG: hypothetical protein KatS3mg068_0196 [Candidatus Sericytochromatia bacterium]|nr:MAG: hypothetical protein KatS3mg068_0196 [Candidatus Sericytochromatia bacterium]